MGQNLRCGEARGDACVYASNSNNACINCSWDPVEQKFQVDPLALKRTGIRVYAIYDRPTDYPESIVVRGWEIVLGLRELQPDADATEMPDVEAARKWIKSLVPEARCIDSDDPDPNLVEVWM